MEQKSKNIVDIRYQQTGEATATNALGMREMQSKAYEARQKRFLLIKAPPASDKSRALMFIALSPASTGHQPSILPILTRPGVWNSTSLTYLCITETCPAIASVDAASAPFSNLYRNCKTVG